MLQEVFAIFFVASVRVAGTNFYLLFDTVTGVLWPAQNLNSD